MTATVERRDYVRRRSPDQLESPVRTRKSPRRMSPPPRRGGSPINRGPLRTRSPNKRSSSQRTRSPPKEKVPDRARSPRRAPVSRSSSRSPSPRTKRLRRAQAEKEAERVKDREPGRNAGREECEKGRRKDRETERRSPFRSPSPHARRLKQSQAGREAEKIVERDSRRNASREEREKGRERERREARDGSGERRSVRDKNDGGHSRSRHDRSNSPGGHYHRSKHGPHSPTRTSRAGARDEATGPRSAEQFTDGDVDSIVKMKAAEESLEAKDKDKAKPSFELSGKLAEETNRVKGVTLLFNEPPEARKPDIRWRLYVFKGGEVLNEPLYVHRQSCYLFGRERRVADIPTDHPSCSKQHSVIQYRLVEKEQPDGLLSKQVRPYLMDLGSTNGTFINDNRIEPQRYYELFEKDTIRFGNSSREYVILHEQSTG